MKTFYTVLSLEIQAETEDDAQIIANGVEALLKTVDVENRYAPGDLTDVWLDGSVEESQ